MLKFPALYQAADKASINNQNYYISHVRFYLILTILATTLSYFAGTWFRTEDRKVFGIFAACIFLIIIILSIYQAYKRFDRVWYNSRAIAESVKTRTWRYVMRTEPYFDAKNLTDVNRSFCIDLNSILKYNKELALSLPPADVSDQTITESMSDLRKQPLKDRLTIYLKNRVDDQRQWYKSKADLNKRLATKWFVIMVVIHALTIASIIWEISDHETFIPSSVMIVIGNCILSWTQIKRYHDLSNSYSLAAHEITIFKDQSSHIKTNKDLSDFVKDAENAFSREHTQWVARADKMQPV